MGFCRLIPVRRRRGIWRDAATVAVAGLLWLACGCQTTPRVLTADEQHVIDRALVEYPAEFELREYIARLTAPTAIALEGDGYLLIAESDPDDEPRIWRVHLADGKIEEFYPRGRKLPFNVPLPVPGWRIYGPIGGMVYDHGEVYVSHRDENGFGVITALDHKGGHRTVVARLPAQGDYGVTDLAIQFDPDHPERKSLWFGVGTATNSGVVGLDNWAAGWVVEHPDVRDIPLKDIALNGYRFNSANPLAGLFGPADIAVTGPFQSFSQAFLSRVPGARDGKPSGVICSVSPQGGPITIEGHGIHNPRGIAFDRYGIAYFTNDGMEPRGTRPILHDPDALLKTFPGQTFYGWPDYTTTGDRVDKDTYQPPPDMIAGTGYSRVAPLVDLAGSNLSAPVPSTMLAAVFPWMSGASKFQFVPAEGPFSQFEGQAIVALSGDRLPFATGGRPLVGPGDYKVADGYKVVVADVLLHRVRDLVRNTRGLPSGKMGGGSPQLLERPWDVKIGPDAMYILDFGEMQMKNGKPHVKSGSGKIYRLVPGRDAKPATTQTSPQ